MADEFDGLTIARQRIAQEAQDRTGSLDLGCLGLTALPEELFHLTHLRRLNLGERKLNAPLTPFGEWMPYEGEVFRGSSAYLSKNRVDLSALVAFPQLEELSVGGTDLESLVPLADLTQLRTINCWGTRIRDLKPLAKLSGLQSFRCDMTPISDLAPLAGLTALKMIDCSFSGIRDLGPLAQLRRLQWLSCWGTHVSDLGPLAKLSRLQSLDCWATQVRDLGPLAKLSALQSLNCRQTQIDDLEPLAELNMLQSLNFSHCRLTRVPTGFWNKPSLQRVILCETHLRGVPAEVLSVAD
jgi:internalin A